MSESNHRNREPDPAALDELSRAFAQGEPGAPESRASSAVEPPATQPATQPVDRDDDCDDDRDAGGDDGGDDGSKESDGTSPKIIRIDDIVGSVQVRDSSEPAPAPLMAPAQAVPGESQAVVVIGGDDELPDPVYVEGSLDRSGTRKIVFIEDDDTGDAMQPDTGRDARRGIEPRMRERRVAVKRAQSRKRLKWVAVAFAVVVVVVGGLALLGSPLFAIKADQVTVTGAVYADHDRLAEIIDDLVGTPALRVDTQRLERELEAISWVDEARVSVDFPHAATIDIRERAALTTYEGPDGRFRVLDREGRVLDVIDQYPFAYMLISGPDPVDLEQGEFAPVGYAAASELAKNLTASVRGQVQYVDVTADGARLVVYLDDGSSVFFGEARDLFAKLVRLETVLAANPDREPGPIDVSTDDVTL